MSAAKYKETLSMTRQEAADRIIALGRALSADLPVTLMIGGRTIALDVSEPLVVELEAKVGDVVDFFGEAFLKLGRTMGRESYEDLWQYPPNEFHVHVVLADMNAVSSHFKGNIRPVVYEKRNAEILRDLSDLFGVADYRSGFSCFFPQLNYVDAAFHRRSRESQQVIPYGSA